MVPSVSEDHDRCNGWLAVSRLASRRLAYRARKESPPPRPLPRPMGQGLKADFSRTRIEPTFAPATYAWSGACLVSCQVSATAAGATPRPQYSFPNQYRIRHLPSLSIWRRNPRLGHSARAVCFSGRHGENLGPPMRHERIHLSPGERGHFVLASHPAGARTISQIVLNHVPQHHCCQHTSKPLLRCRGSCRCGINVPSAQYVPHCLIRALNLNALGESRLGKVTLHADT